MKDGRNWQRLPDLPNRDGVAGAFAGVSGGALLVAGGANFPGKKLWEGGTKVWHDAIYVLEPPDGAWKTIGKLPRPLGYGVSATWRDAMIVAGGSDANRHCADVFQVSWERGRLTTTGLPPLPKPVANGCGALVRNTLYVCGGQQGPEDTQALATLFALDLAAPKPAWKNLAPLPGNGRILAVAAADLDTLWIFSGAELSRGPDGKAARRYLRDVWKFHPADGWSRGGELPRPAVAAPSPAPRLGGGMAILGGDDGTQVNAAPAAHRGFSAEELQYSPRVQRCRPLAEPIPAPRVAAPCVNWNGETVVLSGEVRPGIRSPEVWVIPISDRDL